MIVHNVCGVALKWHDKDNQVIKEEQFTLHRDDSSGKYSTSFSRGSEFRTYSEAVFAHICEYLITGNTTLSHVTVFFTPLRIIDKYTNLILKVDNTDKAYKISIGILGGSDDNK